MKRISSWWTDLYISACNSFCLFANENGLFSLPIHRISFIPSCLSPCESDWKQRTSTFQLLRLSPFSCDVFCVWTKANSYLFRTAFHDHHHRNSYFHLYYLINHCTFFFFTIESKLRLCLLAVLSASLSSIGDIMTNRQRREYSCWELAIVFRDAQKITGRHRATDVKSRSPTQSLGASHRSAGWFLLRKWTLGDVVQHTSERNQSTG